jgi:hypothetical protein
MDRLMVKEPVEQFAFAAFRQKLGKIGKGIERKLPKLDTFRAAAETIAEALTPVPPSRGA